MATVDERSVELLEQLLRAQVQQAAELQMIKRVLVAGIVHSGMSQDALAEALGVNQSTISRHLAGGSEKKKGR
jgi:IS30 family transposase